MASDDELIQGMEQVSRACLTDRERRFVVEAIAEVLELRRDKAMAFRLMRSRDDRLSAIRDCVRQNKGDDLVRVEVEYLLDCPYSELDAKKERTDGE